MRPLPYARGVREDFEGRELEDVSPSPPSSGGRRGRSRGDGVVHVQWSC